MPGTIIPFWGRPEHIKQYMLQRKKREIRDCRGSSEGCSLKQGDMDGLTDQKGAVESQEEVCGESVQTQEKLCTKVLSGGMPGIVK